MRIVILINQAKQALIAEIVQSRLAYWLKRASIQSLETSDVWSKLYQAFAWSNDLSLAHTLADQSNEINGHCLIATPVKVVLGMRDSESHRLSQNDSQISQVQQKNFNEFFENVFKLHTFNNQHYLLEFEEVPKFNLEKQYWPPYLNDYRVQVQAAQGDLVRHLTEMQAWCHQQNRVWNALYLWSNAGQNPIPHVSVDDRTERGLFSVLKLLSPASNSVSDDQVIAVDDLTGLDETLLELEARCKADQIDELVFSFTDNEIFKLSSNILKPWWKKILRF